jgi:hypothetical protein
MLAMTTPEYGPKLPQYRHQLLEPLYRREPRPQECL